MEDDLSRLRGTVAGRLDGIRVGSVEARAQVARQPHHAGRGPVADADGWQALHDMTAAAFGDRDRWRACIPARDDDTDLVVHRWVRDLTHLAGIARAMLAHLASEGAEEAVIEHATTAEALEYIDAIEDDRHRQRARAETAEARVAELEAPGECQSLHKLRARVAELEAERDALADELAAMRGDQCPAGHHQPNGPHSAPGDEPGWRVWVCVDCGAEWGGHIDEAAEARLAYALREVQVIRESLAESVDPYDLGAYALVDPYDLGAYALAEDIEAILTGRADDIEPEQGEEG